MSNKIEHFTDLEAWKAGKELAKAVYRITGEGTAFSNDWGLRDQIRRAAISVSSNLAEGFADGQPTEFFRFARYAYRSSAEVLSQSIIAQEIGFISDEELQAVQSVVNRTQKLIGGLMRHLRSKR